MTTYQFLITAWKWNSVLLILCAMVLAGYFLAFQRRGRPRFLGAALAIFLFVLISPGSAVAGGYFFSAHMIQHILLVLIVPAFLLLSLPRSFSLPLTAFTYPFIGWIAGVGAMW